MEKQTQTVIFKKIDVMSYAKLIAAMMALIGFIAGLFFALIGATLGDVGIAVGFGIFSIIVFPILYGIMGFVIGVVGAAIYNFFAGHLGGIKVEIEEA